MKDNRGLSVKNKLYILFGAPTLGYDFTLLLSTWGENIQIEKRTFEA